MNKVKHFLRGLVGFSVSTWIGFLIGIVSVPILTRLLDPTQFAIINLFNAAVNLMLGVVSLGMDSAYVRFFYEPPEGFSRNTLLSKGLLISLAVLGLVAVITTPFYVSISGALFGFTNWAVTFFFVLAIAAQLVIRYFTIQSRMLNNVFKYTIIALSLQLTSKFAVLLALPFEGGKSFLLAINASGIMALAIWLVFSGIKKKDLQWSRARLLSSREYIKYSFASWPVPIVIYANVYISQIILKHYAGSEVLGVFLSANIFASILAVAQGGFANFWSGYMMANYSTDQKIIKKVHDYVCLFVVLAVCGLVALGGIIYLVIGPEYVGSKAIFPMVMMTPLCNMIVETTAYGISIAKKAHHTLFAYFLYFILNSGLALLLVPKMGMLGAGLAVMGAAIVNLLVQTVLGQKYYTSIENPLKTFFATSMLAIVAIFNYVYNGEGLIFTCVIVLIVLSTMLIYLSSIKAILLVAKNQILKRRIYVG